MKIKPSKTKTKAGSSLSLKRKQNKNATPSLGNHNKHGTSQDVLRNIRKRNNVDAWDVGASERQEYLNEKKKHQGENKRLKFEPAPASFQLPSREEQLRKRMGDFAGPLLGTLWEAETTVQGSADFLPKTIKVTTESKKVTNQFSVLESSDEEDETYKKSQHKETFHFKPASLPEPDKLRSVSWNQTSLPKTTSSSTSTDLFKPASFNAEELMKQQQQHGHPNTSSTFTFKPATFQVDNLPTGNAQNRSVDADLDDL